MINAYSTIKSVRDEGITPFQIGDEKVRKSIIDYSKLIDRLTGLSFIPVNSEYHADGGTFIIRIIGKPPLIKLNSVSIINSDQSKTVIDSSNYIAHRNTIKFNYRLPEGYKNVIIDGVFGYLENNKEITVKTASIIQGDSVDFNVEDASELEVRDILTFGNKLFIINSIDYATNKIFIDKVPNIIPIPIGTETVCYGSTPQLIEKATILLVKHSKSLGNQFGGRIKQEKTDDYQYTLFDNTSTTGVPEVDTIIQTFLEGEFIIEYL